MRPEGNGPYHIPKRYFLEPMPSLILGMMEFLPVDHENIDDSRVLVLGEPLNERSGDGVIHLWRR